MSYKNKKNSIVFLLAILCSVFELLGQNKSMSMDDNIELFRFVTKINDTTFNIHVDAMIVGSISKGYLTFEDNFSSKVKITTDSTCNFSPYIILDKEIRFVLKPKEIEGVRKFKFSYTLVCSEIRDKELLIKGSIMYLNKNQPQPLLHSIVLIP